MINNSSLQRWDRLEQKHLNQQFINQVMQGMECSPFEAKAILDTVHKVFGAYFNSSPSIEPGQVQLVCVGINNSPKEKLSACQMVTVTLTVDDNVKDLQVRKKHGIKALRRYRLQRVCTEAFQQGGLLTVEDLAYRLFNCGVRTLNRDIKELRQENISLPLRSTIKDMGRTVSHRSLIVKHWLTGKEYAQIARDCSHSVEAVQNYIDKFKRAVSLSRDGFDVNTIAFLVKISPGLVQEYFRLYQQQPIVGHRKSELATLLKKTAKRATPKKKG